MRRIRRCGRRTSTWWTPPTASSHRSFLAATTSSRQACRTTTITRPGTIRPTDQISGTTSVDPVADQDGVPGMPVQIQIADQPVYPSDMEQEYALYLTDT